jgi:uncharacterized protein
VSVTTRASSTSICIQAGLVLECQRCLEALVWPCDVQNRLLLLRSGDPLPEDELENDAVDALEVEPLTDLLAGGG